MIIKLEHDIGDKLWVFKDNKPTEATITDVAVWIKPNASEPQWKREVHYNLDCGMSVCEGTEGRYYFKSKKDLVDFILKD